MDRYDFKRQQIARLLAVAALGVGSRPEQRHAVHYRRMACSPCMFVHDNKVLSCWFAQALCMRGIAAEDVLASVKERLAEKEAT